MRIGVLQAGKVNDALVDRWGEYPPMFETLFGPVAPQFAYRYYVTVEGELPASADECDAWIVTGSRHGVYDVLPWIEPLKAFLREARAAGRPILGICFGHQIVASAFGGHAEKSDRGWGLGRHAYDVHARPAFMADAPDRLHLYAVHQDQVTALPEDATLIASNDHCPYAMVAYGEPDRPDALTVQPHPEFETAFVRDLIALLAGDGRAPAAVAEPALAGLDEGDDSATVARWAARFLVERVEDAAAA
ncbi:MAG: gamma-glutamyl-gamma-aminobutyrate hydrolase family protein [Paracoccaceae bacterium]